MITTTVNVGDLVTRLIRSKLDVAPGMRQVATLIERIVKQRFDTSRDVRGRAFTPLYPRPENAQRRPLKKRGVLQASIRSSASATEARVGTPLLHARILNAGGRTRPHQIRPRAASVLAWTNSAGERIFAGSVQHPGSDIPEREFMALNELEVLRVKSVLEQQILRSLRRTAGGA